MSLIFNRLLQRGAVLSAVSLVILSACRFDDRIRILEDARRDFRIPGLAAAIVTLDSFDVLAAGFRKLGEPDRLRTTDLMHVGSTAKSMLATVAAREVEAGHLLWNATLESVIPEAAATAREEYRHVTLTELLSHHSGLPAFERAEDLAFVPELTGPVNEQRTQFATWVLQQPPAAAPGEFLYSNAGYVVAAAMLEHASGKTYERLMQERLFRPLQMHVRFDWPAAGGLRQPWGHSLVDGQLTPIDPDAPENHFPAWAAPAGNVSVSVVDFARYLRLHLDGLNGRPHLLQSQSFELLHTPVADDYALGWIVVDAGTERISLHDGSNDAFYALMIVAPRSGKAVIAVANADGPAIREGVARAATELLNADASGGT